MGRVAPGEADRFTTAGVGDARLKIYLYHIPPVAVVGITKRLVERLLAAARAMVGGVGVFGRPLLGSSDARSNRVQLSLLPHCRQGTFGRPANSVEPRFERSLRQ
jgi:hypothetical protein